MTPQTPSALGSRMLTPVPLGFSHHQGSLCRYNTKTYAAITLLSFLPARRSTRSLSRRPVRDFWYFAVWCLSVVLSCERLSRDYSMSAAQLAALAQVLLDGRNTNYANGTQLFCIKWDHGLMASSVVSSLCLLALVLFQSVLKLACSFYDSTQFRLYLDIRVCLTFSHLRSLSNLFLAKRYMSCITHPGP